MPKRSEKRDTAKAEYIAKKKKGEEVSLRALAGELGVSYQTLRNWKAADKWEEALPKKKRGGQPGNQNSKGKRNAAGSHDGAPPGNKNAEKDGAYSTVFFDMLSAEELKITESVPLGGREALEHEMKILKFREHKILAKIAEYESQPEDALFVSSLLDMRTPGGRGKDKKDGANQTMGMYSKDSAFSRVLKLQEALYKVQGRIAKIADSLRALEESDRRMALEKQRLEILRMRATGAVDVPDPDGTAADDLDAPLEEDTEGMTLYTSKVIAQWLCLTERRVRQLRDEGVIVEARPGLYELQPTVARYIKYLGGAGKESLNTERMKLTAEKRKAAEMDNDLRRGDLHSTQDIEKGIQTMCLNIRSRFLAMPAKLSPTLAAMDGNQAAIFDEMKKAIDETLEELSDYRVAFAVEDTADERTEEK